MSVLNTLSTLRLKYLLPNLSVFRQSHRRPTPPWNNTNQNPFILSHQHTIYLKTATIIDEESTRILFNHIEKHVVDGTTPVLEMRPENGLLTKKLLEAGVKTLHVYEARKEFRETLTALMAQYPDQGHFHNSNFVSTFFANNMLPAYNCSLLEDNLPVRLKKSWEDSPSIKLISTNPTVKVMIVALIHLSKTMMYLGRGRPQLFLTVPMKTWDKLVKTRPYYLTGFETAGLLFPDFYEIEVLGTIPPPVTYSISSNMTSNSRPKVSNDEFVTISIAPSKDLQRHLSAEALEEYLFFSTQTMNAAAKPQYVVPHLEKYQHDCGRHLIANGITCFKKFCDLTASECVTMFKVLRALPSYESSVLKHEFNQYMTKYYS